MNLITADMLLERGAFCSQVKVVRKHWPDGVVPSLAVCLEAAELRLDLDWFAQHFLSAKAGRIYWADIDEARRICLAAKAEALWAAWQIDNPEPRSEP